MHGGNGREEGLTAGTIPGGDLMIQIRAINHVTLIVDDLEKAREFYTNVLGLEELPAYAFDYPVQFYRINEMQQLHLTEWQDTPSFRGHVCLQVADFNEAFRRLKALGAIDTSPWGKVRRLRDGTMQMFARDPSRNLLEISHPDAGTVDAAIWQDELVEEGEVFVSGRGDARGTRSEDATLYHGVRAEGAPRR
jgi:catechol 2,3-dioxygenase-like lactoylglutathione lyase family enzyme